MEITNYEGTDLLRVENFLLRAIPNSCSLSSGSNFIKSAACVLLFTRRTAN